MDLTSATRKARRLVSKRVDDGGHTLADTEMAIVNCGSGHYAVKTARIAAEHYKAHEVRRFVRLVDGEVAADDNPEFRRDF